MSWQVITIQVAVDLLVCHECKTSGLCEPHTLERKLERDVKRVEADYVSTGGLPRGWKWSATRNLTSESEVQETLCGTCAALAARRSSP